MFPSDKLNLDQVLQSAEKFYADPRNRIDQLLDTQGDGKGTIEMVDDTPKAFFIQPPVGEVYALNRMNIYIEEGTNNKFDASKYGATTALSNGIIVSVQDANGNLLTLTPLPVTKIGLWDLGAGIDMFFTDFPSGTSDMAAIRWSFFKGAMPIYLIGDNEEKLVMNVQDNLGAGGAALVSHIVQLQGFKFRPPKWWGLNLPKAT